MSNPLNTSKTNPTEDPLLPEPQEQSRPDGYKDLSMRLIWSAPMLLLALAIVYLPLSVACLVLIIIAGLALEEYRNLCLKIGQNLSRCTLIISMVIILGGTLLALTQTYSTAFNLRTAGLSLAWIVLIMHSLWLAARHETPLDALHKLVYYVFGILWIGWGLSWVLAVMATDRSLLLLIIAIVIANDSCAYFGGKRFGKHKLAPSLSPGKSCEGTAFGLAGGLLVAGIAAIFGDWNGSLFILAIVVGIFSQLGDLLESMLKRAAKVDCSSNLIAGHGGVLDRIDGYLLAIPASSILISMW